MKNNLIKVLFIPLLAISFVTQAQASPWWWPGKAPVKTVQLALPANNGGLISVTVPSNTTSSRRTAAHLSPSALARRAKDSTVNQHDDERIASDLARHF
jgi:hypothetical protein